MRKVLIFLLAFGGGLAILLLLREPRPDRKPAEQGAGAPVDAGKFTELPLDGEAQGPFQVQLRGALSASVAEEEPDPVTGRSPLSYKVTTEDTQPLGGDVYEAVNLRIEFYDPETGELEGEATSSRTRLRILYSPGERYSFGENGEVELSNVELVLRRGAPVVPITMRVPLLKGSLQERRFRSDDLVQASAQGLDARGTGLELDMRRSSMRLVRDGRIDLDLQDGGEAVLESTGIGPIDFKRIGPEGGEIEVRATEGARLSLTAEDEIVTVGDEIAIRASSTGPPEERRFRATQAIVRGGATIQHDPDPRDQIDMGQGSVFRSQSADVSFGEDGRLAQVSLVGRPTGRVRIARFLEGQRPELFASHADVSGEGPLILSFGARTRIDLAGPGEIRIHERAFALSARERIVGNIAAQGGSGEVEARGDVRVEYEGRVLESQTLGVRYEAAERGKEAVDVEAEGPARLTGLDPRGRRVTVDAAGGGSFRARAGRLSAPIARGVRIEVAGPRGYTARADEVYDLDWDTREFRARGNVVYETDQGRGSSAEAIGRGPDEIELLGDAKGPAVFELFEIPGAAPDAERRRQGRAEARRLVLSEAAEPGFGKVAGYGDVTCRFDAVGEGYGLRAQELELRYALEPVAGARPFDVAARGGCKVDLSSPRGEAGLTSDELEIHGRLLAGERDEEPPSLGRSTLTARGAVSIDYRGRGGLSGEGDELTIDERGAGRLSAGPGRRVHAVGRLPDGSLPYEMTADWIEFDQERIEASNPEAGVSGPGAAEDAPGGGTRQEESADGELRLGGKHFRADRSSIVLEGEAWVRGLTRSGEPWRIQAGAIVIKGRWGQRQGERLTLQDIDSLEAHNGFEAELGERMRATGRRLTAHPDRLRIEGGPARFELLSAAWESDWIELDPENLLVGTGRGTLRPREESEGDWTLTYESMQPFDDVDATMLVLRNPIFRQVGPDRREVRAAWALFWLDRKRWLRSGGELIGEKTEEPELRVEVPPEGAPQRDPEGAETEERIEEFAGILNEIYIEGNIEFLENDRRLARASAFYLDRLTGHGWVQNANVVLDVEVGRRTEAVRVKARWMRVSADLTTRGLDPIERLKSMRADKAVITTCGFEEPHYVIETGDLRIRSNSRSALGYDLSARRNRARFLNGLVIPLPPIDFGTDEEGNPVIGGLEVGDSARFGSVIRATTNLPLPGWSRRAIAAPMHLPIDEVSGGTRLSVGYLSSRGLLLGIGQQIRASDRMWLDVFVDAVPDSGKDRGLVREKTDSDTEIRHWFHARGRLLLEPREWIDLAFTRQSDSGFQAEFFEREFLRYEEQDNYLHWRKARDQYYYEATAKVRLEDFRTSVEELPAIGAYRAPTPLGSVAGRPLLYSADLDAGYYRRRFGEAPFSPFSPVFPDSDLDGDGTADDFEVLRFDTEHKLEAPIPLGVLGLRATPFVSGRATLWDQGAEEEEAPSRLGAFVGLELATSFWRRFAGGTLHQIAPTVGVRTDVATAENGDTPVFIDGVEVPIEGSFVDLGLRTVWRKPDALNPDRESRLDIEVKATHATDAAVEDGFLPVRFLGEALYFWDDVPLGIVHDGRYDPRSDKAVYSRTSFGVEPHPKLGLELGYHQGRDAADLVLFRAATVGARYRATAKWEFGVEQTLSLLDNESLDTTFLVRRLGHDFVIELALEDRAGEGNSFGFRIEPQFSWKRSRLGLLDSWLGTYR